MTDRPKNWWRAWTCDPGPVFPMNNEPPVFASRHNGRPPFSCTVGFRRRYLGVGYTLLYWPKPDRLVLAFRPAPAEGRPDSGVAAERTMPDTKEELIAWCRMVVELS